MSTNKEKEILERQRLLAARLNKDNKSSTATATKTTSSMSMKRKTPSTAPGNEDNHHQRNPQKRPSSMKKRPEQHTTTTAKTTSSAVTELIAAARAKAQQSSSTKKPPPSSSTATLNKKTNLEKKPSPRVTRKALLPAHPSVSTSLSKLVQSASKHINDPDLSQQPSSSFPIHQPDDFWKNLRDWDLPSQYYYHIRQQQQQQQNAKHKDNDDDPSLDVPNNININNNNGTRNTAKPLPDTFLNSRHYVAAWAPLCLAECRSQLLQEVLANIPDPILVEVKSTSSSSSRFKYHRFGSGGGGGGYSDTAPWMDDNLETGGNVIVTPKQKRYEQNLSFLSNDVVLLLQPRYKDILQQISNGTAVPPTGEDGMTTTDPEGMHAMAGISLIGHTESARRELDGLILKVSKRKWATIGKHEMYLIKIGSNVTALREFTALCAFETLPMKQFLLGKHLEKAENRRKLSRHQPIPQLLQQMGGDQLGDGFLKYAEHKFNRSQLTAIAASAHEYGEGGFTLIKGPPETTTLVAVLNSLHIRQFNKYYEEVRRIAISPTGSGEQALALARRSKPRLLVCAPSNAAIDNIILKIMEDGFIDGQGKRYNPSMIRVGVGQSPAVRAVALENRVDTIFADHTDVQQLQASMLGYRSELSRISRDIASFRRRANAIQSACQWPISKDWEIRIDEDTFDQTGKAFFVNHKEKTTTYEIPPPPEPGETQFSATAMPEYRAYLAKIVKLVESYFSVKSHLEQSTLVKASFDNGANLIESRMNIETHILNSVHMVMTTLGSAGNRTLESADRFEVIVVDEAAQSVEPASLSALRLGSRHAVLVGDPQQLPATIFNISGKNSKYDRSLFQRLEEAGQPVYMLNEQYRMHPKISHFPRHIFYGGALMDGPNVIQPDYGDPLRSIICRNIPTFSPLMILDLDSKEERGGTSLSNLSEAKLAVYLYEQLKVVSRGLSTSSKVAVITPYAQQMKLLRRSFEDLLGSKFDDYVEVNTVDAFQGREANIVIFSAVRAAGSRGIGFLSDVRRMNVALTRAKFFLFVIARCESIVVNPYWADLVQHARETNAVVRVPFIGHGPTSSFGNVKSWTLESC